MEQYFQDWYNSNVKWAGSDKTNKSFRRGYTPEVIVNHITEGTAQSCIDWFNSDRNTESSAHFLVARDGKVYQFVAIEDNAWANGLNTADMQKAKASIVKNKGVNPNWYSVSIEHEGIYKETKGALTAEQLESTIMLHRYISSYVKDKYGKEIPFDRQHILGHCEIDPINRPNCPGEKFPFDYVIVELNRNRTIKLTWKEILKKVTDDPEGWEKAVAGLVTAAEAGVVNSIYKYLPLLIEKIHDR